MATNRERDIKREKDLSELLEKVREIHAHVFPKEEEDGLGEWGSPSESKGS